MTNMMMPSNRQSSNFSASGYRNQGKKVGLTTRLNCLASNDKELQGIIQKMRKSCRTLQKLEKIVKKTCKLPSNMGRTIFSKLFYGLMPRVILRHLPTAILEHLPPEEQDFLDTIAMLMRKNTNDTQGAALDIKGVMQTTETTLIELRTQFETAKNEKWDAKKLQECLAELAGIQINDEVQELLNQEYDLYLPEEEKEIRRINLLNHLESIIRAGEENMQLLARSGNSTLQVLQKQTAQLAAFEMFKGPSSAMKRTAEILTGANESIFFGRDVLMVTIEQSVDAMESALDSISMVGKFSIAGPDMLNLVKDGCQQLDAGLENVKRSDRNLLSQTARIINPKQLLASEKLLENMQEDPQPQPASANL